MSRLFEYIISHVNLHKPLQGATYCVYLLYTDGTGRVQWQNLHGLHPTDAKIVLFPLLWYVSLFITNHTDTRTQVHMNRNLGGGFVLFCCCHCCLNPELFLCLLAKHPNTELRLQLQCMCSWYHSWGCLFCFGLCKLCFGPGLVVLGTDRQHCTC